MLEHTSTSSMLLRGVLWLVAGILAINGFIQMALDVSGRATADQVAGWIVVLIGVGVWAIAMLVSLATAKTRFDFATGTLSIVRFGRARIVRDINAVIVGAAPASAGAFASMTVPLSVATATGEHVIARGTHEDMTALKARVDASVARATSP